MNIARSKTAAVLGIPALAVGFLAFAGSSSERRFRIKNYAGLPVK